MLKSCVSEIRVKGIRVNQGVGVLILDMNRIKMLFVPEEHFKSSEWNVSKSAFDYPYNDFISPFI